MAITAFPALAPRLKSVAYADNFKPSIQKYDWRSDPNIWLSTYYVLSRWPATTSTTWRLTSCW
jgi:hypothetical protein